ncbi:MAG: site-specific integrase [Eubacteriales bacterium]|nr:site-specific integrase [Eubacteriales bacterium]
MTGSIQQKNGKFYVVLSYKTNDNKFKTKWVATGLCIRGNKKKAKALIPDIIEKNKDLEYLEEVEDQLLFTDAIIQWLERKKNKVQLSTWEGYEIYSRKHIIPYFKPLGLTLQEIKPKHIQDYYEYKFSSGRLDGKGGGLDVQSIRKHSIIIKQVFNEAMISELVDRNPAAIVPLPKQEKAEQKGVFLTVDEANKILEAFRGHELQALVYTTLYYGLRRSEVLGLKWSAVDFENNTIKIQHTVVKNITIIAKDSTKSASSNRTYPLLTDIKNMLLEIQKQQNEYRSLFGNTYVDSDYIFTWQDGKPFRPDYITRGFQRVLKRNDLSKMRFHDLRHSTASILYDKGWGLKDIQEWLGHSDIEITGNIYTHISNIRKNNVAKDLENTFKI